MACKLKLAFALVPAVIATQAYALGLGGMRLQSALDQPFTAEIDLLDVKPDELDAVKAQVASQAEFARSGTERYHHLTKLRFSPQISPRGKPVIRVSSREPIREPYMDFLVEVVWPKGRLVKQYTLLLDPPVTAGRAAPAIASPAIEGRSPRGLAPIPAGTPPTPAGSAAAPPGTSPASPPVRPAAPQSSPELAAPPRMPGAAVRLPGGKRLEPVRPGTTLWHLARAYTPPGATVSQTATALYRNNPDAFINGNINRLRVGRTLVLPPAAEVFALSPEAAKQEFDGAIRGKAARRTPLTAPGALADGGASDPEAARLRLAGAPELAGGRGDAGSGLPPALEKDLLLARETSESARQETTEMRGRIRDLEAQLAEIQQLLKLRNEQLERVQGAGQVPSGTAPAGARSVAAVGPGATAIPAGPGGLSPAPGIAPPAAEFTPGTGGPVGTGEPAAAGAVDADLENPLAALPPAGGEAVTAGQPAVVPPLPAPTTEGAAGVVVSPPAPVVTKAPPRPTVPVPAPTPPPAQTVTAEPSAGDSTWRALLMPLAGVAAVTAIGIGALTWLRSRRRGAGDSSVDFDSTDLTEDALSYSSSDKGRDSGPVMTPASGSRPARAADLQNVRATEPQTSAYASFKPQESETDEADAISEADIYIAYGRYREAEELLREEILRNPGWMDLRFKLAEALFGAKNSAALRALADEVQAAGGDRTHPEQWRHLMEMAADTPSEVARGGVQPALAAGPPPPPLAPAARRFPGLGSDLLGPSTEHSSSEVYELDISDAQKPSADLALSMGLAPIPERAAERRAAAASGTADGISLVPPKTPVQVATQVPAATALSTTSQPPGGTGLGLTLGRMGMAPPAPRDQVVRGIDDAISELDLSLEDLRGGDLDLYSAVDSTPTAQSAAQPTAAIASTETAGGALELSALASQSEYPRVEPAPTPTGATSGLGGILGQPDDSASTDLLSSQWQMDSGLWDETATKLDLARAYLEMGDKESARGILEEVRNEGSEDQRAEAQALLLRAV